MFDLSSTTLTTLFYIHYYKYNAAQHGQANNTHYHIWNSMDGFDGQENFHVQQSFLMIKTVTRIIEIVKFDERFRFEILASLNTRC